MLEAGDPFNHGQKVTGLKWTYSSALSLTLSSGPNRKVFSSGWNHLLNLTPFREISFPYLLYPLPARHIQLLDFFNKLIRSRKNGFHGEWSYQRGKTKWISRECFAPEYLKSSSHFPHWIYLIYIFLNRVLSPYKESMLFHIYYLKLK